MPNMSGRGNGVVEIAEIIRVILLVTFFHLGYSFQCVLNSRLSTICTGWQFPAVQKLRGKKSGKAWQTTLLTCTFTKGTSWLPSALTT